MSVCLYSSIVILTRSFRDYKRSLPPPPSSPQPSRRRYRRERQLLTLSMEIPGVDSDGKLFKNTLEMWREEIGDEGDKTKKTQWYRDGVTYWEGVEASVDGVLGGYGHVNDADITGSGAFLETLLHERLLSSQTNRHLVALDCGSGIGRITKNLLIRYFNEVDLLEPVVHFLDAARENLALTALETHRASNFFSIPLQEFTPANGRYDVIWVQWCIGHLTDVDFVSFFNRAKAGLKPGFVLDKDDRSITRSDLYFKKLFHQCGLHLYKTKDQKGLPDELFAVKMYALTVDTPKKIYKTRSKAHGNRPRIIK